MSSVPRLLTYEQAAELLGVRPRMIRRLVEQRRIPHHKVGRFNRIAEADVERFIAAGRVEAAAPSHSSLL